MIAWLAKTLAKDQIQINIFLFLFLFLLLLPQKNSDMPCEAALTAQVGLL
jgi:hypothetical protein